MSRSLKLDPPKSSDMNQPPIPIIIISLAIYLFFVYCFGENLGSEVFNSGEGPDHLTDEEIVQGNRIMDVLTVFLVIAGLSTAIFGHFKLIRLKRIENTFHIRDGTVNYLKKNSYENLVEEQFELEEMLVSIKMKRRNRIGVNESKRHVYYRELVTINKSTDDEFELPIPALSFGDNLDKFKEFFQLTRFDKGPDLASFEEGHIPHALAMLNQLWTPESASDRMVNVNHDLIDKVNSDLDSLQATPEELDQRKRLILIGSPTIYILLMGLLIYSEILFDPFSIAAGGCMLLLFLAAGSFMFYMMLLYRGSGFDTPALEDSESLSPLPLSFDTLFEDDVRETPQLTDDSEENEKGTG